MKRAGATGINLWLQKLLLLHMLLAALVPAGYMPAQAEGDGLTYIICTPNGLKVLPHFPGEEPEAEQLGDEGSRDFCTWFGRDIIDVPTFPYGVQGVWSGEVRLRPSLLDQVVTNASPDIYFSRAPPA